MRHPTRSTAVDESHQLQLQTPEEIARELRASARTVRRWIALGLLPARRVRRRWLVRRDDALALLKSP